MKRKPGTTERLIAMAIVLVLVCVAGGVLIKQQYFHPAVKAMLQAREYSETDAATVTGATKKASPFAEFIPAGFIAQADYQTFSRDTLSDKINGKADGYLQAGFETLQWQAISGDSDSKLAFQAYVFDMADPSNAFSVFSRQRRSDAPASGVARHAYTTPNSLCFVHGPYYVELIGSATGDAMAAALDEFARAFVAATIVGKTANADPGELFPLDGMVTGSLSLVQANAFGFDRLDNVYTARYRIDTAEAIVFVSLRESHQEAGELADAFAAFWKDDFDAKETAIEAGVVSARLLDLDGYYEIVFSSGRYLAGVHQATEREAAELLAGALAEQIKQADK